MLLVLQFHRVYLAVMRTVWPAAAEFPSFRGRRTRNHLGPGLPAWVRTSQRGPPPLPRPRLLLKEAPGGGISGWTRLGFPTRTPAATPPWLPPTSTSWGNRSKRDNPGRRPGLGCGPAGNSHSGRPRCFQAWEASHPGAWDPGGPRRPQAVRPLNSQPLRPNPPCGLEGG